MAAFSGHLKELQLDSGLWNPHKQYKNKLKLKGSYKVLKHLEKKSPLKTNVKMTEYDQVLTVFFLYLRGF
jgi:hypothetical protein